MDVALFPEELLNSWCHLPLEYPTNAIAMQGPHDDELPLTLLAPFPLPLLDIRPSGTCGVDGPVQAELTADNLVRNAFGSSVLTMASSMSDIVALLDVTP